MSRVFISINIPDEIKEKIKKIQEELPEFKGKRTELENLHLTLKFLGEIDEKKIAEVKEKLKEIKFKIFETEIDSIGIFSPKFIKIIWLHLTNCEDLQKKIDDKLENLFRKENRFMGHLTIARVKHLRDKVKFLEELEKIKIEKIKFRMGKFYLMESKLTAEGPKYSILEEYILN